MQGPDKVSALYSYHEDWEVLSLSSQSRLGQNWLNLVSVYTQCTPPSTPVMLAVCGVCTFLLSQKHSPNVDTKVNSHQPAVSVHFCTKNGALGMATSMLDIPQKIRTASVGLVLTQDS